MKISGETIVISDCHLGAKHNNKVLLLEFLKKLKVDVLVLNGDFIDGWRLERNSFRYLDIVDVKIFKELLKLSKKTTIYWIRGNHDEFISGFNGESIGNIHFREHIIIHDTLILHGDQFDLFSLPQSKWLAKLGGIGYGILLFLNKPFHKLFKFSLSALIKKKVKSVVKYLNSFEIAAAKKAESFSCNSVICGHIHTVEQKKINSIEYINSGDWQESCDYITWEDKWKIKKYAH